MKKLKKKPKTEIDARRAMGLPSVIDQSWVVEWQQGRWYDNPDFRPDFWHWWTKQPEEIRRLVRRFPPGCLVISRTPLMIPSAGTVGIVVSYNDPDRHAPEGYVNVVQSPDSSTRGQCLPKNLDVVGYRQGFNRDALCRLEAELREAS